MDERPVDEIPTTTEPASSAPSSAPNPGSSAGRRVRSLLTLILCCAAVMWAWRTVREGMEPLSGWSRLLNTGNIEDRQVAAQQLGEVGPKELKVTVPLLVAALGDRNEKVRAAVAVALNVAGLTAMRDKANEAEAREISLGLTRALLDSDEEVQASAAIAMAHLASASKAEGFPSDATPVVEALVGLVNSPSLKLRKLGRQALTELGPLEKVTPSSSLVEGMNQWERADSRAEAANALGSFKLGVETTVPALIRALKDPQAEVRSNAAVSLRKLGLDAVPAIPALVTTLDDSFVPPPPPPPRFPGIAAALSPGGASSEGDVATDPAAESARALGQIQGAQIAKSGKTPPEVIDGLTKALYSSRPALQEAAEEALKKIGKGASATVPRLIQSLAESLPKPEPGFGSKAATLLGSIAPGTDKAGEAIAALTAALDAKEAGTRSNSVEALGKFGSAALPVLDRLRALGESDKDLTTLVKTTTDKIEGKAPPEAPRRKGGRRG